MIHVIRKDEDSKRINYNFDPKINLFYTEENDLIIECDNPFITFNIGDNCDLTTDDVCVINAGSNCNIKTGNSCVVLNAEDSCFETGRACIFHVSEGTFKVKGPAIVIHIPSMTVKEFKDSYFTLKTNGNGDPVYDFPPVKHTITIDGKDIEISHESFENLKKTLIK